IANVLNSFFNNGIALPQGFSTPFGLTGPQLQAALTQLSGEGATGGSSAAFVQMAQFLGLILDPFVAGRDGSGGSGAAFGYAPEKKPRRVARAADKAFAAYLKAPPKQVIDDRWGTWASGFGGSNHTSGDVALGSNDFSARVSGYAGGIDYKGW